MKLSATIIRLGIGEDEVISIREKNSTSNEEFLDPTTAFSYILGRFTRITEISHQNLCKYFELNRCLSVPNGYALISEHYSDPYIHHDSFLNNKLGTQNLESIFSVAIQVCSAIDFCHKKCFALGSLSLDNLFVVPKKGNEQIQIKLSQFGLCFIVGDFYQKLQPSVVFPLYQAPELFLNVLPVLDKSSCFSADIWSFGILLIELFTGWRFSEIFNQRQIFEIITSLICKVNDCSILDDLLAKIRDACPAFAKRQFALNSIRHIIENCLNVRPSKRQSAGEMLKMLKEIAAMNQKMGASEICFVDLDEEIDEIKKRLKNETEFEQFGFCQTNLNELFFLWKLCGSNFENILIRKGTIKSQPPLSLLPSLLVDNFQMFGASECERNCSPITIFELPMNNLVERLHEIHFKMRFLSLELKREIEEMRSDGELPHKDPENFASIAESQSLIVKERDIEYQYQRMHLFRRLLAAWPSKSELLRIESRLDIPPVYRGAVWAALLGVLPLDGEDYRRQQFYSCDTFSEHVSDRQLQVDIPRCHQYDELMSSPMTHHQLKILLKALLLSRKDEFVYWQGLDSLSAPFLIVHFNDLPTAFHCLNAFIDRYLRGFFLKDNSKVIRNYLAEFMRVIEFSDSELFAHLISLDFHPELFAIPWFLTCFAHVLPLHKLFHIWDALLLSDSEFPLFIGVAILLQLRPKLITSTFNEAILLFSDLPDLPIDDVVNTAKFFHSKWRSGET